MRLKFVSLFGAALLLAACSSTPDSANSGAATGAATTSSVIPGSEQDLVQNVGDRVFFDFDKYDLKPEGQQTLERQAQWLKAHPQVTVSIEGHCDPRGTREYNLALGERRATAAKNYLVALGIDPNRVETISYGKERPAVAGDDESAFAQDRRAVTVVAGSPSS
jgi:peptidoglycan-associated lipoprotein